MTAAEIQAYVDAAARALQLPLSSYDRPAVLRAFTVLSDFAAVIEAVPLDVNADAAMVFVPLSPKRNEA